MENGRRLMGIPTTEQTLLDVLNGDVTMQGLDLPDDARAVRVFEDFPRKAIVIIVESQSFEPVPFGSPFPMLPPFVLRRKQ